MRRHRIRNLNGWVLAALVCASAPPAMAADDAVEIGQAAPDIQAEQVTWVNPPQPFKFSDLTDGQLALVFFETVW